jgi:putative transposase
MRALKIKIRGLKKPQFELLGELTHHAKNLYNQTLWTLREAFDATGKYFSYYQMDKAMKQVTNLSGEVNYKLLKAKVSQQTLRKLDKNFLSFFRATQDLKNNPGKYKGQPRPPRFKQKQFDNLVFDYQAFKIEYSLVVLKDNFEIKSFKMPSGQVIKSAEVLNRSGFVILEKGLEIELPKQLIGKAIKQVEVIPKYQSFHAVFVYDDDISEIYQIVEPFKTVEQVELGKLDASGEFRSKIVKLHNQVMSIDLGLNNLATCVTNGVIEPFIIDGRRLKSVNAYYNKRKAKMQSKLSKRGKKWSRRLQSLTNWRNAAVNDYMHRATSIVVKTCVKHGISQVVVGDVAKSLNGINLGKKNNQNFVNLSLGQFVDLLGYKLGSHGIELVVANESYTSKASFVDDDKMPKRYNPKAKKKHTFSGVRVKRGLYKSSNGTLLNADANGAYNILRKTDSDFSFSQLAIQVGTKVKEWLHPTKRVRFWLKKKEETDQKSNPKPCPDVRRDQRGDKGLILPSPQC